MSHRKNLVWQIALLLMVIALFVSFNVGLFSVLTQRLSNNFSGATQAKMVDVKKYLPFEEASELAEVDATLQLTGDLPVLDGAAALYPVFSGVVNSVYPEDCVHFENGEFTADSALHYTNTIGAYKAVADGDADVIFCAKPNDEQLAYAEEKGAELEMVPIGREAFVFIVNERNPVDSLSSEQVRDIFSGEIKSWSEVGGEHLPIEALSRNKGSGSQTTMDKFMSGREQKQSPLGVFGRSIGYSFRYYAENMTDSGVKLLALDGAYPDREHIADGSYPLASSFYAIYRRDNDNEQVPVLIDWLLSDEGQSLVEQAGYVPIG